VLPEPAPTMSDTASASATHAFASPTGVPSPHATPHTYKPAMESPERDFWDRAMNGDAYSVGRQPADMGDATGRTVCPHGFTKSCQHAHTDTA
jgi:hypothetical protein